MLTAIRKGLTTSALVAGMAACGGAEPEPSPTPDLSPGDGAEPTLSISPDSGSVGDDVQIQASGFEPGQEVGIGFGPPNSEFDIFTRVIADGAGGVTTTVAVPDWAESGREYVFAVSAEGGRTKAISTRFRVTGEDGAGEVRVTGVLTDEGVECQALRTDSGTLYTLAGDAGPFQIGDRVEVRGTIAELSYCQQGTTITVEEITAAG